MVEGRKCADRVWMAGMSALHVAIWEGLAMATGGGVSNLYLFGVLL